MHPPERVLTFGETAQADLTFAVNRVVGVIAIYRQSCFSLKP
jgi:hypothetical protein